MHLESVLVNEFQLFFSSVLIDLDLVIALQIKIEAITKTIVTKTRILKLHSTRTPITPKTKKYNTIIDTTANKYLTILFITYLLLIKNYTKEAKLC